ncbi:MAG TPA: HPr family phosphocarrier protein [Isosphaeraceae bacterium]|jgi:phosphocarrier protein|nr:HPr family phosphocarrier protein [Isosphaeraceae bacterium]
MLSYDRITARRQVVVPDHVRLGLRTAGRFVNLAATYRAEVKVYHRGVAADGKSILDLTSLTVERGKTMVIEADGPDAEPLVDALADLILNPAHLRRRAAV